MCLSFPMRLHFHCNYDFQSWQKPTLCWCKIIHLTGIKCHLPGWAHCIVMPDIVFVFYTLATYVDGNVSMHTNAIYFHKATVTKISQI